MGWLSSIVVVIAAIGYFYNRGSDEVTLGPIVKTNSGSIQGIVKQSRDGRDYVSWLQIPYAQPPVGPLRFQSPRPGQNWEGVRDGSQYGAKCPQLDLFSAVFGGEEDCLFLNVHAPKVIPTGSGPLPVLVFIHGGSFVSFSGEAILPDYFMDEDVIMITMNYRLGVLGFFSTGDKLIRGNMGLKDQVMALKWIKNNAHHFGGNSEKIIIIGNSAGAAAIHYLTLTPTSRGLFSKAISMGATSILPWSFTPTRKAVEKTKSLGRMLGCNGDNMEKLAECLQTFPVKELLSVYRTDTTELALFSPSTQGVPIVPTVEAVDDDEAFLTQEPYDVISQGKQQKIPHMFGVVRDEGLLTTFEFINNASALYDVDQNYDKCFQHSFTLSNAFTGEKASEVTKKIRDFYFSEGSANWSWDEKFDAYTRMYSDGQFLAGTSEVARVQRESSPVYLYYFNVTGGPSFSTLLVHDPRSSNPFLNSILINVQSAWDQFLGRKPKDYGIAHAEDGPLFFPMFSDVDKDNRLYKYSKDLIKLFVSYAHDETKMEFRGKKFTPTPKTGPLMYFKIDEDPGMVPEPMEERMKFWHSINYTQLFSSSLN